MKTIYTLITFLFIVSITKANPIILRLVDGTEVTNATYTVFGVPTEDMYDVEVHVQNNTDTAMQLKVRRRNLNVDASTQNYFCWYQCYAPQINVDPGNNNIAIAAGGTNNTDFHAYYKPQGFSGIAKIRYTFFNILPGHSADSSSIEITFNTQLPTQPILLQEPGSNFITNTDVYLTEQVDTNNVLLNEIVYPLAITNNTNVIKQILVKKRELNVVEGSQNFFSWKSTFNPTVIIDTAGYIMLPNTSIPDEFKAIYRSNGKIGESIIQYVVFNKYDPNDSSFVNVHFNVVYSSVNDLNKSITRISVAPNPASDNTIVTFNASNNLSNASLKIINMLGAEVANYQISNGQSKQIVSTENLENGLYFCQIVNNNKIEKSIKLIVSK